MLLILPLNLLCLLSAGDPMMVLKHADASALLPDSIL